MNIFSQTPALIVAIPLFMGFLTPLVGKLNVKLRDVLILISLLATTGLVLFFAFNFFSATTKLPVIYVFGAKDKGLTLPSGYEFPIRIIFEIDAISIFMSLITSVITLLSFIYSIQFMKRDKFGLDKFYSLFLVLTAGIFGMEFTGDLFNLFVLLEITSIAACALIAFRVDRGTAVLGAFRTIVMFTSSALLFLFAVALLYGQYDSLNIGHIAQVMNFSSIDMIALVLFLSALALKAGAFPMHLWVPDAYGEAPSNISMILVVNTQAGLYVLMRILFTLYGLSMNTNFLGLLIVIFGILSIIVGATMALANGNLKKLIAFVAVSQIGYMLLGLGVGLSLLGTPQLGEYGITAMKGAIFHIINDALCVGLLFLTAGAVAYRTSITDLDRLGGLARKLPYTTVFFIIAGAGISGLPPFNGFVSKLLIYESVFRFNPLLAIIAIFMSIITLAIFTKVFYGVFLGKENKKFENVKEVPKSMVIVMALFAILIVVIGLFPELVLKSIVEPAVFALINQGDYISAVSAGGGSI